MDSFKLTFPQIEAAHQALKKILRPTPLVHNALLSDLMGCEVYLKLENMQPIGSFKIRGATYKISKLTADERKRGVIAASAGNHAQGVAWGSRLLGVKSLIVMPVDAPLMKVERTRALGAEVHFEGKTYDEAFAAAQRLCEQSGRVFVHAFDDPDVMAGQGTCGIEITEQLPDLDVVIGSLGGGGWMAGISVAIKKVNPKVQIYGCQASGASALVQSLHQKKTLTLQPSKMHTFADGIAVAAPSDTARKILQENLTEAVEVDDEAIASAVVMFIEKAKVVTEGAGAISLAALEILKSKVRGKKVVLLLSGGNIDVNLMGRIVDRGLIRAGKRVRVDVLISDRTGSLSNLTKLIAEKSASVIQVIHDRNELSTKLDETKVELTLETKGPEHSSEVLEALKKHCHRVILIE